MMMEVTAANFQALFAIVQLQMADTRRSSDLKRLKTSPHAPVDSPNGKRYFIDATGGWVREAKGNISGSASSSRAPRRFIRINKHLPNPNARRTPEAVLGQDGGYDSCQSRKASESEEP